MRLEPLLKRSGVVILTDCATKDDVLRHLARLGAATEGIGADENTLYEGLARREAEHPTATPQGVAFPHAILPEVNETVVLAGLVRPGVEFGVDRFPPTDLVFCMLGNPERPWEHVQLLARLARIAHGSGALDRFRKATDSGELFDLLVAEDRAHG